MKNITRIISHADCADGIASALICQFSIPDAKVEFIQYNTPERNDLIATNGMLFVDMTPPPDRAQQFVDVGAYVLDHHRGAEEVVAKFGERGVFVDRPGISGASLAWQHVYLPLVENPDRLSDWGRVSAERHEAVERFATLAGTYDTFQTGDDEWEVAQHQAAALLFWPRDYWLDRGWPFLDREHYDVGKVVHEKVVERAKRVVEEAWLFNLPGGKKGAIYVNRDGVKNEAAEQLRQKGVNITAGFRYQGRDLIVSFRSDDSMSALAVAKTLGGSGHERAAGCRIKAPGKDPYELLQERFEKALR